MKKKLSELAAELSVTEKGFDLVTVKKPKYYVYWYERKLNGIENVVVFLSYPEKAVEPPKSTACFYQHKCGIINIGDSFLLCVSVAN